LLLGPAFRRPAGGAAAAAAAAADGQPPQQQQQPQQAQEAGGEGGREGGAAAMTFWDKAKEMCYTGALPGGEKKWWVEGFVLGASFFLSLFPTWIPHAVVEGGGEGGGEERVEPPAVGEVPVQG